MKKTFFLFIILFTTISMRSDSQTITNTYLKGTWNSKDTIEGKMMWQFFDKFHYVNKTEVPGLPEVQSDGTYELEAIGDVTVLRMTSKTFGPTYVTEFLVKQINIDTIKLQIPDITNPHKWAPETNNTTTYYRSK